MLMNTEQVPKPSNADADPVEIWGRLPSEQEDRAKCTARGVCRGMGDGMLARGSLWQHGKSHLEPGWKARQPVVREDRTGPDGMADRSVVPEKLGSASGGKGPWFKSNARRSQKPGDWP